MNLKLLKMFAVAVGYFVLPLLGRCALNDYSEPVGRPLTNLNSAEQSFSVLLPKQTFVGLACSGGGSRAAYFTAAVLREIHRSGLGLNLTNETSQGDLLAQIDVVSSVSGGSLAAADFVLNNHALTTSPADSKPWEEYSDKMALPFRSREWWWHGVLNPLTWVKTLFGHYNRGNLARGDYDKTLYQGATFADLPDQPALYVNATDVANRVPFVFSKHQIDDEDDFRHMGQLGFIRGMLNKNDLILCRVDPQSIRLADAVYASSAYPFAYPHLALRHFGSKIIYQGNLIFLADGGLIDNSGLLTLLTQMRSASHKSPETRLVLAIYIDASLGRLAAGSGTAYQSKNTEQTHARSHTYLGHGSESLDAAIDVHEDAVFQFLKQSGVVLGDLVENYSLELATSSGQSNLVKNSTWDEETRSGKLALRPLVIGLRLQDIDDAYYHVWMAGNGQPLDPELAKLFRKCGIPDGMKEEWPALTYQKLGARLLQIKTDFKLRGDDRQVLDLAAYLLVHGRFEDALNEWNQIATSKISVDTAR